MSITIGSAVISRLVAQPFGYEETNTRAGLSARKWLATGLCTPSEWADLLEVYEDWRDLRILEEEPLKSGVVGATVSLTASANGMTYTAVPCWFITAPSGEQVGAYVQASVEVVDAAQALAVLLSEVLKGEPDLPDLGTFTINGAVITLTKPPETYQDIPQMQLTAGGFSYLSGAYGATVVRDIEGTTDSAGWVKIQQWYAAITASTPNAGAYFPLSPPTASATNKVALDGETPVKVIEYSVALTLGVLR